MIDAEKKSKIVVYQVFTRSFGNKNLSPTHNGSLAENGVGKMNNFSKKVLKQIKSFGATHIWYTGIIRHATTTDYTAYNIPTQHADIVKGKAGSPYAITDYYDVDPDLAEDVLQRMSEFEALIERSHQAGLKVLIDFVPNHVARQYKSICKPIGVEDLGENDDIEKHFYPQNNFYYCPHTALSTEGFAKTDATCCNSYTEYPAKCTGNDRFDANPQQHDWYETIKLNYGVDYCNAGGRSEHFDPIPSTWLKMTSILLFWASKGVDGFRCDMAEMVPTAFWAYATKIVKQHYPNMIFIGEVYNPSLYRAYIEAGFTYLYDKVGMYDCLRDVVCEHRPAAAITSEWQQTDDIRHQMLYFLENHDEQRIASDFFCGDAFKAIPAFVVSALFGSNPVMIYAGQEFGESGMHHEGFSGLDGRSTIFDYWSLPSVYAGFYDRKKLKSKERELESVYKTILNLAHKEAAFRQGATFDLMYVNPSSAYFNPNKQFAFLRAYENELIIVVVNFDDAPVNIAVNLPQHAFDVLNLKQGTFDFTDLITKEQTQCALQWDKAIPMSIAAHSAKLYKCSF